MIEGLHGDTLHVHVGTDLSITADLALVQGSPIQLNGKTFYIESILSSEKAPEHEVIDPSVEFQAMNYRIFDPSS